MQASSIVKLGQYEMLEALYDTVPEVLSELIRTAFIPKAVIIIVAIFLRLKHSVIAWLAGETWRNEVSPLTAGSMKPQPVRCLCPT